MKIVALETGSLRAGLAAVEVEAGQALIAAVAEILEPRALSRELFGQLDALLKGANWKTGEIDALAVGLGPGSWTSLRVGISVAKTLAQVWEVPLFGVPTFDAVASAAFRRVETDDNFMLLAAAPCRPGEFYGKIFQAGPDFLAASQAEWIASARTLTDAAHTQGLADDIEGELFLVGDAAEELRAFLAQNGENPCVLDAPPSEIAVEVALAGAAKLENEDESELWSLAPLYLALSNAERNAERNVAERKSAKLALP